LAQMDPSTHSRCSTPMRRARRSRRVGSFGIGWCVQVVLKRMEAHHDLQITGLTPDPDPTLPAAQAKPTPAAEPTPYRPPGPPKGSGLHRYSASPLFFCPSASSLYSRLPFSVCFPSPHSLLRTPPLLASSLSLLPSCSTSSSP
jgi:hypothetical protein